MKLLSGPSGRLLFLLFFCGACSSPKSNSTDSTDQSLDSLSQIIDSLEIPAFEDELLAIEKPDTTELEHTLISQGLVNILDVAPDIQVEMKYSTDDNFLHEDVYEEYSHCYLQKEVAEKLKKVQASIKQVDERLSIIVFDCVRPRSVQYKMWEIVKGTEEQKYVAAPGGSGSMHNYGAAVDLSLVHLDTGYVDMGTPFDFFGKLAQPRFEEQYLKEGKLSKDQFTNRRIMRAAMLQAGFHGILSEWWHFNAFPREVVKKKYQIVE